MLYPVVTSSRAVISLDGIWDFELDHGNGFEEEWFLNGLPNPVKMPVPASYNDLTEEEAYREHYGWVFYQRTVRIPHSLLTDRQRLVLRFGAAAHAAKIYWNGELICEHKGGFLPFETEIGSCVQKENLLTVAVDNKIDYGSLPVGREQMTGLQSDPSGLSAVKMESEPANVPNFDFFNYCGLIRPVVIYSTPVHYIDDITLSAEVKNTDSTIYYRVKALGEELVTVRIFDKIGKLSGECQGKEGEITIADAHLWQPLNSYLYQVHVQFGEDEYILPFGIRTVKVEDGKFLINGKPFYFKGFGKHEDTWPAGRGLNIPMNVKDISLMKWIGANSFRTSHYPYSEEMMRLCDEEGIVVIDEAPAVGVNLNFGGGAAFQKGKKCTYSSPSKGGIRTLEHHKNVIRDMIDRDKNHACVVMWSIANEPDSVSAGAYEYFKPLFELAKKEDIQKRPCTLVSIQVPNIEDDCTLYLSDVICLNRYYGWYTAVGNLRRAEKMLEQEMKFWNSLGKPFMFTEYGADTVSGFHDTIPSMFTEEYQVEFYKMNHRVFDKLEYFVGEQVWNFADFATSQGLNRVQGNKKGIFTRDRKPKSAAYYLKDRWNRIPDFGYKAT